MSQFRFLTQWSRQATQFAVLVYQIVILSAFLIIPILAYQWVRLPFLGAFIEQTLVINQVTPSASKRLAVVAKGSGVWLSARRN